MALILEVSCVVDTDKDNDSRSGMAGMFLLGFKNNLLNLVNNLVNDYYASQLIVK